MLETITRVNDWLNNIVWGVPAMVLILGVGLLLTIGTRCIQVRRLGTALKETVGKLFNKTEAGHGAVTPIQAVCTALAGTVGTGNIAGVAGAIAVGGPGAVFWMWVSAFLGMCTKMVEVVLAVKYRERDPKTGEWVGGPMYFIKNGLGKNWMWLAVLFSIFGCVAMFGIGNATQTSSIVTAINTALCNFGVISDTKGIFSVNLIIGIAIAALVVMVLLGGIKRIGSVTERLIPFMAILYIVLSLGVIIVNIKNIPATFALIFREAFAPRAVAGGTIFLAMKKGIARGIFSNEAGLGSASIAHATADTDDAVHQGLFGIFEVFADTIVICTLTALVVLCSGTPIAYGQPAGAELTISGFTATYGGWVSILTAVALVCFAFSTTLGWGLYGSRCVGFLFGSKAVKPFMVIYALVAILGATLDLGLVWNISDTFNGLMAIPNLIAVALLSPVAFKAINARYR